ncbi:MAG: DNRLRE domain-containing protein, partial [Anaerolineae bacterium]
MRIKRTFVAALMIALLGLGTSQAATIAPAGSDTHPASTAAAQTTVVLDAVADATVRSGDPDENFGGETSLELSYWGTNEEAVVLLRFDLSSLPSDAIVDSASLRLYLEGASGASPVSVAVHFVTSAWEETGEEGVTWDTHLTTAPWPRACSMDRVVDAYKSCTVTSYAQSWLDTASSNYGVMLRGPADGTEHERWFQSRESMEMVPQLEVTYHLPTYVLSGRVYEGDMGDPSTPLSGVAMTLYCSNAAGVLGPEIDATTTDATGWYGLDTVPGCEYYHIVEEDPEGYTSVGSTTVDGTVRSPNWIEYVIPLKSKTLTGNKFWDQPGAGEPDLIVTDIWPEGGQVCCQIRNVGTAPAPSGHEASLTVDGVQQDTSAVDVVLEPAAQWEGCFEYAWPCSGESDTVVVTADAGGVIAESDETNNRREEVWACDTTPPQIVAGPTVAELGATEAVITWETDEVATSVVRYDTVARLTRFEETGPAATMGHEVVLEGLTPSTTYHYIVRSTDAAGNAVESGDMLFETEPPPDTRVPTVHLVAPAVVTDTVTISADADDDTGVEKVVFCAGDTPLHTDYTPPYTFALDTTQYPDGLLGLAAEAHDAAGKTQTDQMEVRVANLLDPTLPTVKISTPADGATVQGNVQVKATVQDNVGLYEVSFTVDGSFRQTKEFSGGPTQANVTFEWDTTGMPGGDYTIGVVAYDLESLNDPYRDYGYDTADVTVQYLAPPPPAKLQITRSVTRYGNVLWVNLHVTNVGGQAAEGLIIHDWLHGFQPISHSDLTPVHADYDAEYFTVSQNSHCSIVSHEPIPKNATRNFSYAVVPILSDDPYFVFEHPLTTGFKLVSRLSIGYKTELGYYDRPDHWVNPTVTAPAIQAMTSSQWKPLLSAYFEALASADYVIVTNPKKLHWAIKPWQPWAVNDLLSDMAWLAKERQGVVGYMDAYDRYKLRDLIAPGGTWAKQLAPKFSTALGGYVLIVGESEIVPSWTTSGAGINYTDQPYAGDTPPERIVGRIVGNTHAEMSNAIRASLGVKLDWSGYDYDRSSAALISGTDGTSNGVGAYKDCINDIAGIVSKRGITPDKEHLWDISPGSRPNAFKIRAQNDDIIVFRDHGFMDCWCPVRTNQLDDSPALDLGTLKPFAFSLSCLAGCYEPHPKEGGSDTDTVLEAFFDYGVAAYIGATDRTPRSGNNAAGRWFFRNWHPSESIGEAFTELEAYSYASGSWAMKYNIYGDPKFGAVSTAVAADVTPKGLTAPVGSIEVVVPDYEVSHQNGTDYVSFPAGHTLLTEGEPEIPFHVVRFDYPAGTRVQAVTLVDRAGLTTTTGLNLPITTMAPDCALVARPQASNTDAWLPDEDYAWRLIDNPDGTTTLEIAVYAFQYHPLTTGIRFYQTYTFNVTTAPAPVTITHLTTDQDEYEPGAFAHIDLEIVNTREPRDVVVEAVVKPYGSDEVVAGLLLTTLDGLQGEASFAADFDIGAVAPDLYLVEVTLRDIDNTTLKREATLFRVGTVSGQIASLTAMPTLYDIGDEVHATLIFLNIGTLPITGTMAITILDD